MLKNKDRRPVMPKSKDKAFTDMVRKNIKEVREEESTKELTEIVMGLSFDEMNKFCADYLYIHQLARNLRECAETGEKKKAVLVLSVLMAYIDIYENKTPISS